MEEKEERKDMGWSGESELLEEWNFVVHTNKRNTGTEETASDGESVEILSRERVGDSAVETDDNQRENESQDGEPGDSDELNTFDDDNDYAVNEDDERICSTVNDDALQESSPQIIPAGVFPEENIIPVHSTDLSVETALERSDLELPLESRKIIIVAGLVLFIGWFLFIFHVRSEEYIDKIKLDNDIKWQIMNEKYSKLMQELAIYKEKSQLMDSSLNDLKALQVDGKAVSCKFNDEKWQLMHEKYLKLESELATFKEGSSPTDIIRNSVKNRMKQRGHSSFSGGRDEKSDCGTDKLEKPSYCNKNGQYIPQHSEILRLIQRLDSKPDSEKYAYESDEESESVDLKGKFFNIKRAFETADVKSFEEDFEKLYEILSSDFVDIDMSLIVKYNAEMYESFLMMMDESKKLIRYMNESDARTGEELHKLAHISYEYVVSNLQKSNYNIAKLVNDYHDFAKAIAIDIGYSARRYGQKHVKKSRDWKSFKSDSSKESFDDPKRKSQVNSKDRETFNINLSLDKIFELYYRVVVTNEEIRKLLKQVPQAVKDSDSYVRIVCDLIHNNLQDANVVLSKFMDSFDNSVKKIKFGGVPKKHYKKDDEGKQDFRQHKKEHSNYEQEEYPKVQKNYEKKEERRDYHEYKKKFDDRKDQTKKNDENDEKSKHSFDQDEGTMFKFLKSKINNYRKIISDKATSFNSKLKNHTMHVKEKFQKKIKSVLDFEKAKKLNEKIMHHGTKIKNKLTQKFDSLWDSVSKRLKNATNMAVASGEWLFDFSDDEKRETVEENKEQATLDLNNNNWMFKRAEFRNAKREDTAYWYFRRGNARKRNIEKYKKL